MIILNGKTLGDRQQQLNKIVNDAAEDKVDFNVVIKHDEKSDIDKFFNIDLAAKYRNLEYILEIFKGGDHLHISRALSKCSWLYDDEFKHIVNIDYLSKNIIPSMSIKIKKKMLTAISTNMKKNDTRAVEFCAYCMKRKLNNIALKFLIHTSNSFKLEVIAKKTKVYVMITQKEGEYLKNFIGDSFDLAENYVNSFDVPGQKSNAIYLLRYMYSLSNEKYLDMLETCDVSVHILGRRLSKHIIKNYKLRVTKKPLLYATVLNKDIIKRNFKIEDAKIFAVALLPDRSTNFFSSNYYTINKFVLDLIPAEEKFTFIKKIFNAKYKDEPFETSREFYLNSFYEMMTPHERQSWALHNIANQNEIQIIGYEYVWYKFVNFEKAFDQLRKEIMKTNGSTKRCEIFKVLLDSAKTEDNLTKVFNYFLGMFRNEMSYVTERFLSKLIKDHKVWSFSENCWNALVNIFYNVEQFRYQHWDGDYEGFYVCKYQYCDDEYKVIALMYYVINKKPVPEFLSRYLDMDAIQRHSLKTLEKYIKMLHYEKGKIYQYILQYYIERIKKISSITCEENTKTIIRTYLRRILDMALCCGKTEDDLPEIVLTNIKLDWLEFEHHDLLANSKVCSSDIMHYLKQDATLVVTQFHLIKKYCELKRANINWLVHKLKVYFSNDVSEKYLELFYECLSDDSSHCTVIEVAVRGILSLANWAHTNEFVAKYTPTDKKIDRAKSCNTTLNIQRAICRQMLSSRPPLPLPKVFQYVTGDYVHYCLVLFRSFIVNLPQSQCLEFIRMMINSPTSIQKHGLRLAFECIEVEKLQIIVLDCWNKTENGSLRRDLYKQLSMKISEETDDLQMKLFDVLIKFTLDLNEEDHGALILIDKITLPDHLVGRYLEVAWDTVSKFSEKPRNFARMSRIIQRIGSSLHLVPEKCVDKIINDHVHFMFDEEQIKQVINENFKDDFSCLLISKSNLIIRSLVYMTNEKKLGKNLEIAKHIVNNICIEMWDRLDKSDNKYVVRQYLKSFITEFAMKSYDHDEKSLSNVVILTQAIEHDLKEALPEKEIYQLLWILQSSVMAKKIILDLNLCTETLKADDIKGPSIKLGKDFGMLIKTRVEKGTFYRIFRKQTKSVVTTAVVCFRSYFGNWNLFSSTDILILFCLGLLEHEILETYELALNILPSEYEGKFLDAYINAFKKIRSFKNEELQFYMYEKFVNTDFIKRNYVD